MPTALSEALLVFDDLDDFEEACKIYCRMALYWNLSDVLLAMTLGL